MVHKCFKRFLDNQVKIGINDKMYADTNTSNSLHTFIGNMMSKNKKGSTFNILVDS